MEIYKRSTDLKNKINNYLKNLSGIDNDFYLRLTQSELIELKSVFSDINNVLTLKATISAANWLCKYFKIDKKSKIGILEKVDKEKPNTKGYDINITEPYKIIAEVKCISPVNKGGAFGAAQWNSILDDFIKLKSGKKDLLDTTKYYKFVFLLDLGERTDKAISKLLKESKANCTNQARVDRHNIKKDISLLSDKEKMGSISFEKLYLRTIRIE